VLQFPNFGHRGNKGRSVVDFNDAVKLRALVNPVFGARIPTLSVI